MTLDQFIDICHLAVNGGELNPDSNVKRVEVAFYAPYALREAADDLKSKRLQEAAIRKRLGMETEKEMEEALVNSTIFRLVQKDARGRDFVETPKVDSGVPSIYPAKSPDDVFAYVSGPAAIAGIGALGTWAWYEKEEGAMTGKMILTNASLPTGCEIAVTGIFDLLGLNGDDVLPVGGEVIPRAIDRVEQKFLRQRGVAADPIHNYTDVNEAQNVGTQGLSAT